MHFQSSRFSSQEKNIKARTMNHDMRERYAEDRNVMTDVLSIYVPTFFIMIGLSIISPILSIYAKSFGVSYATAALAVSIYAVARLFFDIPVGVLGDRFGRRPVLLFGSFIITVSAFLCAYAQTFWELLLYRFIQGVGSSMWQTMRVTLLQDILRPEERGRILSYFQAFMLIGSSAGPTIGGVVAEIWGMRAPFYAYGLGSLICLILSYFFIKEPRKYRSNSSQNSLAFSLALVNQILKNATYSAACIATLTLFFLRTGLRSTLIPLYGEAELNLNKAEIGYAISLSTLTNLLVTIPVGHALDKFGRKIILVPSLIATSVVAIIFSFTNSFVDLSLACILLGLSTAGGGQASLALASDATIEMPHGLSMGLYRVFGDVGFIIGPILVGIVSDAYGLKFPFYVVSAIVFISAIVVQLLSKETLHARKKLRSMHFNEADAYVK